MNSPTVWCPSCGDEYVAGSQFCSDCRVALVDQQPEGLDRGSRLEPDAGLPEGFVELGSWPRLATAMLTRRLEDAGVDVATQWNDPDGDGRARLAVPEPQLEFADAVVRELPVDDELPSGTLHAYVERIEARLAEVAVLLDELRDLPEFRESP